MTPPVFRCSSVKDTSLRLHYTPGRKSRHSLAPLIVGIVKALAELVVKNIHSLTIVTEKPSGKEQAQFFISWKRIGGSTADSTDPSNSSLEERDMEIGLAGAALNRAFPFHIILNTDAEIVQYGQVRRPIQFNPIQSLCVCCCGRCARECVSRSQFLRLLVSYRVNRSIDLDLDLSIAMCSRSRVVLVC